MMKISYCTNCHGRLWQLKQTISHNLAFTKCGEVELCVLAYNDDTVEPFLMNNYSEYINDGRLVIKTHDDDNKYSFGYVKNLSHAMGKGLVLFNLDADNYIDGVHEALLNLKNNEILTTENIDSKDGYGGRIGLTQHDFNLCGGYRDNAPFPDDVDLIVRLTGSMRFKMLKAPCPIAPISNIQQ